MTKLEGLPEKANVNTLLANNISHIIVFLNLVCALLFGQNPPKPYVVSELSKGVKLEKLLQHLRALFSLHW